jgi:hypothetical protein
LRIGYSPLLRQSLLAGNKPLKEAKGRFKISIDALYKCPDFVSKTPRQRFEVVKSRRGAFVSIAFVRPTNQNLVRRNRRVALVWKSITLCFISTKIPLKIRQQLRSPPVQIRSKQIRQRRT